MLRKFVVLASMGDTWSVGGYASDCLDVLFTPVARQTQGCLVRPCKSGAKGTGWSEK